MRLLFPITLIAAFSLLLITIPAGEILLNPGFEIDENNDGFPDHWIPQRRAFTDHNPLNAFEGEASARTSAFHSFIQERPVNGGSRLCLSGFLKGDLGGEYTTLSSDFLAGGKWLEYHRQVFQATEGYTPRAASFLAPPDADQSNVIVSTVFPYHWVSADAFSLVDEFIHNPDFENLENGSVAGWRAVGTPLVDRSGQTAHNGMVEVRCDPDHYFYQELAVYPDKKYRIVFHARSDDASPTPELLTLEFFDQELREIGSELVPFTSEAWYKRFEGEFVPPEGAVLMRLLLRPSPDSHTPIWFDSFTLLAAVSTPSSFSPNADTVFDSSSTVFLLGSDVTGTVQLLDDTQNPIRTFARDTALSKGVHSFEWDGTAEGDKSTSPGIYTVRIRANLPDSGEITMSVPVEHAGFSPLSGSVADDQAFFPRGMWLHLEGRYGGKVDYNAHLDALSGGGFNTVIANWIPNDNLERFMNIADKKGIRAIPHTRTIDSLISLNPDFFYEKVEETRIRDEAATAVAALSSHPSLLGYYIRDEVTPEYLPAARRFILALRDRDPDHPAFSSISTVADLETRFHTLDTSVLLHHHYPAGYAEPVRPEMFDAFIADLDNAAAAARKKKRPLWMILQGNAIEGFHRLPTSEEMRCQVWLALACGAKGIFYFISQSLYQIQGLFSFEGEPFPLFETAVDMNRDLEALAPLILDLSPAPPFSSIPPDHTVRSFQNSSGVAHLMVVNRDCLATGTSELVFEAKAVSRIYDALTSRSISFFYEAGRPHLPLEIPPGDGILLRIENSISPGGIPRRAPREAVFSALSLPALFPLERDVKNANQGDDATLSMVPLEGIINHLSVGERFAYVSSPDNRLHVIDVERPWMAGLLGSVHGSHNFMGLAAVSNGLFCADSWGGVLYYHWNDEGEFEKAGEWWGRSGSPLSLDISGDRAFLASDELGLAVLDISEPTTPVLVGRGQPADNARFVIPKGSLVYLLDEFQGIHIEDVTTSDPVRLKTIPLNRPLAGALSGDLMAVACGEYGLKLFSLKDPVHPVLLSDLPLSRVDSVAFYRDRYLFAAAGLEGIAVIEIEGGIPRLLKFHQPLPGYYTRAVEMQEPYLFALYPYKGLYILSPSRILRPGAGKRFDGFISY